jgi:hypothetical protein
LDVAWFSENAKGKRHEVGKLASNAFGLYDMHGNVGEWCIDWFDINEYLQFSEKQPAVNPRGPKNSTGEHNRVHRGRDFSAVANSLRSAQRSDEHPKRRDDKIGFRAALTVGAVKQMLARKKVVIPSNHAWAWPEPIGANDGLPDAGDHGVGIGPKELSIYFGRPSTEGLMEIWRADRPNKKAAFGRAMRATINSGFEDGSPTLSVDGLTIYWESRRDGSWDIWMARRNSLSEEFDSPQKLPSPVNTADNEFRPAVTEDELT